MGQQKDWSQKGSGNIPAIQQPQVSGTSKKLI